VLSMKGAAAMPDSEERRVDTDWRSVSRFYRRTPGLGWLLALLLIPLLLGAVGYSGLDRSKQDVDATLPNVDPSATLTMPSAAAPNANAPEASVTPVSITRSGNDLTVSGDLPDGAAKASLLDALRASLPGINVIDKSNIKTGVNAPDLSGLGAVFDAAVDIPDFSFRFEKDTLTLTGSAPSEDMKAAVEAAAKAAWPTMKISNDIRVTAGPAPTAPAPAGNPTGTPAPGPGGACANLQADISSLLTAPINFNTDGFTLTSGPQPMLTQVASRLTACSDAKVTVTGYTDNTGSDAINIPLSANRAKSVAEFLMAEGVVGDRITSQGLGAANPVASNASPDGRAQNRRVEITVS
jgi:peptidoglycan-binding protein ArfA